MHSQNELPLEALRSSLPSATAHSRWKAFLQFGAVLAFGASLVAWALLSEDSPFVYSVLASEVLKEPEQYKGRTLRVEGLLQDGSIRFRDEPCEYRFALKGDEESGKVLEVRFPQCIVPDTFREGMGISVVVEGRLEEDGRFLATTVIPRCPSRYEMDERMRKGEAPPHAMPMPSGGLKD
ncbi:MAG: cytochrome c maturation protein CcmE [Sandaracinaceae bacterium]|nr:cytochrome c maturation protein CcmE [Sandaracinaceae bacterium]MDW8245930.1 cytochrome c maturation protein CcmE [Sandaracinaceae bacterium]